MKRKNNIIAVSSGKGGVGKSIISANLAISLALSKRKVVLVDASFGTSNQHAIFGIKSPSLTLNDFVSRNKGSLWEILIDTEIENLKLISSAGDSHILANMPAPLKKNLIKNIQTLNFDYVILDLGPSINFNTIDFFLSADSSIVITTPEITSVTNTYSYIRNIIYKNLENTFKENEKIIDLINLAKDPQNNEHIKTIKDLRDNIESFDKTALTAFDMALREFQPLLILNMIKDSADINVGNDMVSLINKNLNVKIDYLGYLEDRDEIRNSIENMKPFVIGFPTGKSATLIHDITIRLMDLLGDGFNKGISDITLHDTKISELENRLKAIESKELEILKIKLSNEEKLTRGDIEKRYGSERIGKFEELQRELNEKREILERELKLEIDERKLEGVKHLEDELHQYEESQRGDIKSKLLIEEERFKKELDEKMKIYENEKIELINSENLKNKNESESLFEEEKKRIISDIEKYEIELREELKLKISEEEKKIIADIEGRIKIELEEKRENIFDEIELERAKKLEEINNFIKDEREGRLNQFELELTGQKEKKMAEFDNRIREEMERKEKEFSDEVSAKRDEIHKEVEEYRKDRFTNIDSEIEKEKSLRLTSFQQKMENAEREVMLDIEKRLSCEEVKMRGLLEDKIKEEERKRMEIWMRLWLWRERAGLN